MKMKNQIDKVIVASDVSERDGIGVEIYIDGDLAVEIFRDDTDKTRTVTVFEKEINLELMEKCIEIFKNEIPQEFIEYKEMIYLKFEAPKIDDTIESNKVMKSFSDSAIRLLKKILPEANPDYDERIDEVKFWIIEISKETNLPNREIGLDKIGNPIMIMPDDNNYGYWTDNNLKKEDFESHFKTKIIDEQQFNELWNAFVNKKNTDANK